MHAARTRLDRPALLSVLLCAGLLGIGLLRMFSYSATNPISAALRDSPLGALAYQPESFWSVRFFKLLATPVLVAAIYFVFRALNRAHRIRTPGYEAPDRRIDFASPWLRLVLVTVATLHWVPLEYLKFTSAEFYPNSPLEDPATNVAVLLLSGVVAFVGMRRLSFDPLVREG